MDIMDENDTSKSLDETVLDLVDHWASTTPDRIAAEWQGETLTYAELQNASLHVSRGLLSAGVSPCANVPVLTQMSLEMLPAVLGILRVGACYVPIDVAAWSRSRIEVTLSDLAAPVAIVTSSSPGLQLPIVTVNFQREWLRSPLVNADDLFAHLDVIRRDFRAHYLAWIIFTSGSTGKPKGVMVYHSGVYALSKAQHSKDLEAAAEKGVRCLLAYSIAFDGCASVIWTMLTRGGTVVMASPSNFPEVATTCDALSLTPSMFATLDPSGSYDRVRYIYLGAEAPSLEVIRQWITPNRKVYNTYGPSETTCIISFGELNVDEEPPFGDLIPGVRVVLVDDDLQECDHGEVMIAGPGLAAGYLNNPELTAKKFIQWHGERFYRTGDLARRTEKGQLVWAGRADSLIKNRGFLINLETEVQPALLSYPPVRRAVALKWRDKLVGFIEPGNVDVDELRGFLKERFDPFVIPDEILAMENLPVNMNSKIDKRALEARLEERTFQDRENDIDDGRDLSAYDVLRKAFSKVLHISSQELDRNSSFVRLGGNSLTAIRLLNLLRKHGFSIPVIQIFKLDTIGALEVSLENSIGLVEDDDAMGHDLEHPPATDVQKLFLTRSLHNPISSALIGTTKYVGDPHTVPSASELRAAFTAALSAHSIFQTRFDLVNFTLFDLGRLNLTWHEISVDDEADFENACVRAEEQAWRDLDTVTTTDIEVPYFHVTCVSVSVSEQNRRPPALAFITRTHHALTDVFSTAILSRDLERALAGEPIPMGPRIQDFAHFMQKYKLANLERATAAFTAMVAPLSATAILQLPIPKTTSPSRPFDLIRLRRPLAASRTALDGAARRLGVTTSTLAYAAWALFHHFCTSCERVGFSVSMSGRTVPWPAIESLVGPLLCTAPFSVSVSPASTVHSWIASVHQTTLSVLEFDGLTLGLPTSLTANPCTNTSIVLCFLGLPTPSRKWAYTDKQRHNYLLDWYIFPDDEGDGVTTEFEFQSKLVDAEWAESVAAIPGKMLEALVASTEETLVRDLIGQNAV